MTAGPIGLARLVNEKASDRKTVRFNKRGSIVFAVEIIECTLHAQAPIGSWLLGYVGKHRCGHIARDDESRFVSPYRIGLMLEWKSINLL